MHCNNTRLTNHISRAYDRTRHFAQFLIELVGRLTLDLKKNTRSDTTQTTVLGHEYV